jgi:type VI protein secretion system component Hcp
MAAEVPDVYIRLDGLTGECTDDAHPGDQGWVQIKGFSFSFGLRSATQPEDTTHPGAAGKGGTHPGAPPAPKPKKPISADDTGPFDRPAVTLSKTLDQASASLWKDKCYSGQPLKSVEVHACRYGGSEAELKIPFLTLIFEEVVVRSISLQLSEDGVPAESMHFIYDTVKMQYIWTANDTGDRVRGASAPRAGWNFKDNKPATW